MPNAVRASSIASVVNNYRVLQALWYEVLEISSDSENRACLIGVIVCPLWNICLV